MTWHLPVGPGRAVCPAFFCVEKDCFIVVPQYLLRKNHAAPNSAFNQPQVASDMLVFIISLLDLPPGPVPGALFSQTPVVCLHRAPKAV